MKITNPMTMGKSSTKAEWTSSSPSSADTEPQMTSRPLFITLTYTSDKGSVDVNAHHIVAIDPVDGGGSLLRLTTGPMLQCAEESHEIIARIRSTANSAVWE
ncbi:hypothetical protein A5780_19270 [Nocardia sp. 852002-20019_SCH5090214]|uniref:hypothetical protein n=1 Tax=Nocardia sp. 852002-20019_SCH5090214 TaxID=1834087 RepID=UPI0007E9F046|nr:hypothetical protein [Nocardia sp. 852002-20019_SCH5090214]OBA62200.1 hypothetical protein A5780_19270 [Nocardia sp. 852002-20019_SCH5090214]